LSSGEIYEGQFVDDKLSGYVTFIYGLMVNNSKDNGKSANVFLNYVDFRKFNLFWYKRLSSCLTKLKFAIRLEIDY
jgi:hypothetical protein